MSASTRRQQAGTARRRVKYTELFVPAPNAAQTVHSNIFVTPVTNPNLSVTRAARPAPSIAASIVPAIRTSPRRLPAPFEASRMKGGRSLPLGISEHAVAIPVHPHTCDSLDCAMVRAMDTTEILEHICSFLPTRQLLSLQLVNKTWRSLIWDSPQLSLHLFVLPRWSFPATDFQLLLLAIPGLEIKRGDPVHLGQWVEVRMTLCAAKTITTAAKYVAPSTKKITHAGNQLVPRPFKCRSSAVRVMPATPSVPNLLITQPPLKGMHAFLVDAHGVTAEAVIPEDRQITVPTAHAKLSCDAGITLGFLAEVAEWMFEKRERLLQREDHQNTVVVFKAIVSYYVQSDAAPRMRSATRTVTEIESLQ